MRETIILGLLATVAMSGFAEARGFHRWRFGHSIHHSWEYDLVTVKAKRGDFYKVLAYCRRKYPWAADVNAEFSGHYGQHGWFCAYKR